MYFGSGRFKRFCNWTVAEGVSDMAALRDRSRDLRSGFVLGSATDFDFWASASGRLIISGSCFVVGYRLVCRGSWVSLNLGDAPAMDVSGTLVLRGGGGAESSECGWYAGAVERDFLACRCWSERDLADIRCCDR